jgi:hypothetical protein
MPHDIKEDGDAELPSAAGPEKVPTNLFPEPPALVGPSLKEPSGSIDTEIGTTSSEEHEDGGKPSEWGMNVFVGVITAAILFGVVWNKPEGEKFLTRWWVEICAGIALVLLFVLSMVFRRWFARTTAERRTGVVVFAFLPALLIGMGAIALLPAPHQIIALRSVFLIVVCLLPALIYYLFIATRKISLLNDYFINLGRLGLLEPRCASTPNVGVLGDESKIECRVRLLNYLQKFEALYGPVPRLLRAKIMEAKNPLSVLAKNTSGTDSTGIVQVFTAETAIPVILASVLVALGWLLALPPVGPDPVSILGPDVLQKRAFWSMFFDINEDPITYAFLGAYFFSLQMLFRRYVREDLRKAAYVAVSLRIILALIGTWAAVTAIKATGRVPNDLSLAVLGFVIGVFPRVAWQFIQGFTKTIMTKIRLSAVLPSLESRLPVSDLDGLTVWHESRLEEQDIENIPNMASAEIVDLMIGTRFPPDRIIDWVDQAILYAHLGPPQGESEKKGDGSSRREKLGLCGIRTATSLIQAFEKAQGRGDKEKVIEFLSEASRSHVRSLIDAIQTEPNLELIYNWRGIQVGTTHIDLLGAKVSRGHSRGAQVAA